MPVDPNHAKVPDGPVKQKLAEIIAAVNAGGGGGGDVEFRHGFYTGDGTNDRIITTTLTETIRYVRVWKNAGPLPINAAYKSGTQAGKLTKLEDGNVTNLIAFFGSNFTVDEAGVDMVNKLGLTYHWVAFGSSLPPVLA